MKFTAVSLACIAVVISSPAAAAVQFFDSKAALDAISPTHVIETFDGFSPTDVDIFTPVTRGLVTYSAPPGHNIVITGPSTVYTNFGANLNPLQGTVLTASGEEDFFLTFATPQMFVGFDTYLNGLGAGTVKVLTSGFVLATLDLPDPAGGAKGYVGISSDTPFDQIRWTTTGGSTLNTAIDSIAVAVAVARVPLPASISLLALGLLLVAASSRQQRRADAAP